MKSTEARPAYAKAGLFIVTPRFTRASEPCRLLNMKNIRNFSITAHIDHGKSTLADRLIQGAGLVTDRDFHDQMLDTMDIERERGITIKSQTVAIPYKSKAGEDYVLNLIDTPGHVDFTYEVSRALASCEGVLLLVDASQGVEAQTLANLYLALDHNLEIIPVINKIDLPSADVNMAKEQIELELGLDSDNVLLCSAKKGIGIDEILEAVVEKIPPPRDTEKEPLRALIFDAQYDPFRGAIIHCRVMDGTVKPGDSIRLMSLGTIYKVEEVGVFKLKREKRKILASGEVGYIIAGIKTVSDTRIGDTVVHEGDSTAVPLAGFKLVKPVVFSSIYPIDSNDYNALADSLEKYKLNDASLIYQKDSSAALGHGFRCGFLGLLHLEVFQERLEREFNQSIIMTSPSVLYKFILDGGKEVSVDNPEYYPDPAHIESALEPYIRASILFPEKYMGAVMQLCLNRRGENSHFSYPAPGRIELLFDMPLAEVIHDFYDKLKTITQGYGSFDYELTDYRKNDLVKIDILVNGERVDALAMIVHKERARTRTKQVCDRLRGRDPAAHVQDRRPGRDRREDHRAIDYSGDAQGCIGEMLRR